MNIFEIQQSKQDKDFVIKNGSMEFEVFADILKTAENIPYIGSLFKLGKVAVNYMDYCFVRKLHFFLKEAENIDGEKIKEFLDGISEADNKRINGYLTQLLYTAEEDAKATLMGKIYRSRLLGEIDDEMMLRLCSIVNKAFLSDLDHLKYYVFEKSNNDYVCDNLNALGLLKDRGNVYDDALNETMSWGETKYQLNEVGRKLLSIMES